MALVPLLGETVKNHQDENVAVSNLEGNEVVGIYFSAHWCPPCRAFTPQLVKLYNKLKDNGKAFEIVFVSSDRDEKSCSDYYSEMPWLILPFSLRDKKTELCQQFGVSGIPTLIFINPKDGSVISTAARNIVSADPEGKEFPWNKK